MTIGILSDKLETKSTYTKPVILVISSAFFSTFATISMATTSSYYVSSISSFLIILLGDGWAPVAIFIMKATVPTRIHGTAVSFFYFAATVSGTIGTMVVGAIL